MILFITKAPEAVFFLSEGITFFFVEFSSAGFCMMVELETTASAERLSLGWTFWGKNE